MDFKQLFEMDDRAVSPVIGVILMVAITVILAAVIGSFVLGLGGQLQETSPRAQIGVSDHSGDSSPVTEPASGSATEDMIEISHDGGDALVNGDYAIQIRPGTSGSFTTIYEGDSGSAWTTTVDPAGDGADNTVTVALATTPSGDFSVGDTLKLTVSIDSEAGGSSDNYDYSGKWQVQIIHKPSDSIVVDSTVNVN